MKKIFIAFVFSTFLFGQITDLDQGLYVLTANNGLEYVEGTYQISELDYASGGKYSVIKTREIKKIKGENKYLETVYGTDSEGNLTYKFEAKFHLEHLYNSVHLFAVTENRQYSGANFTKKGKWQTADVKYLIEFDEDFLYETFHLSDQKPQYKYTRVKPNGLQNLSSSKMEPLKFMTGKFSGKLIVPGAEPYELELIFNWNDNESVMTNLWNLGDAGNTNTSVFSYDFVSQAIKGRMFNSSGFQIDAIYIPGQSSEKIAVFAESAEEVNGGMYHCITTFDFSEEGKLKWSAINRVSQFGVALPDLSGVLVKK